MFVGNSEGFVSAVASFCASAARWSASFCDCACAALFGREGAPPAIRGARGPGARPSIPRPRGTNGVSALGFAGSPPPARRSASERGERFGLGRGAPGASLKNAGIGVSSLGVRIAAARLSIRFPSGAALRPGATSMRMTSRRCATSEIRIARSIGNARLTCSSRPASSAMVLCCVRGTGTPSDSAGRAAAVTRARAMDRPMSKRGAAEGAATMDFGATADCGTTAAWATVDCGATAVLAAAAARARARAAACSAAPSSDSSECRGSSTSAEAAARATSASAALSARLARSPSMLWKIWGESPFVVAGLLSVPSAASASAGLPARLARSPSMLWKI